MAADRMLSGPDAHGHTSSQGRLVGGRYRLMSPVGRGGMGMVWHAHDVLLDRDVAVKELLLPYGLDQAGKQGAHRRMLREARSAARLTHPGIVTVHDVVEEDGRPWIVMELVRAWSLEQAVRQSGPLPVIQAAEIGVRVLDALRHAHAAGILHRDVKPGNVLLTADRVVLTDFGIAAIEGDVTITQTGLLMGSPAYIPPERLSGQPLTAAADLWSFGATLYAAVEGRPPYEGPDAIAVLGAVLTQEPIRPQRAGALLPVIEGLLRKNPAERMSAAHVADQLERVLRAHGSPSGRPGADAIPTAGNATPIQLLPPLDPPSGPMPSRVIETPSGPVRVPYDPQAGFDPLAGPSGGQPVRGPGADPLASPSGSHPTDLLRAPADPYDSLRGPSGPQQPFDSFQSASGPQSYDSLRSPSSPQPPYDSLRSASGPQPSYDSLRSASGPQSYDSLRSASGPQASFDSPRSPSGPAPDPYDALRSASGANEPPRTPAAKPQPILPLTTDVRSASGASPWPLASPDDLREHSQDLSREMGPATTGTRIRTGRRRAPEESPGRGKPKGLSGRLLLIGGAGVGAVVLAVVLLTSGGDDPAVQPVLQPSASAAEGSQEPPAVVNEIPKGYKEHSAGGFTAAAPTAWKVTTTGGETTFTGPKDSGSKITVRSARPDRDGGLAALTAEERNGGVEAYIQVKLENVDFRGWSAADWEYTWSLPNGVPMHTLTRYVTMNDERAFKIVFSMPELRWDEQAEIRKVFLDSFGPTG
ncbi:protein kinase [Nonomuraea sp. NPDC050310]|uniref:serine/threonine-protein kinase n=1 Tax=Nonomuraea sp. NPDC050310 TaxID=3154935 RepID=UPI0033C2C3CC